MKTGREAGGGEFAFLEVNDGSTFGNLQVRISSTRAADADGCAAHVPKFRAAAQVMVTKEVAAAVGGLKDLVPTGTSVLVEGVLTEAPAKAKQVRQCAPYRVGLSAQLLPSSCVRFSHQRERHVSVGTAQQRMAGCGALRSTVSGLQGFSSDPIFVDGPRRHSRGGPSSLLILLT